MIKTKAVYDERTNTITLHITHNDVTEEVEAIVRSSGTFKFSYHHHELKEPDSYTGMFISSNKCMIYPAYGVGVISEHPIEVESI